MNTTRTPPSATTSSASGQLCRPTDITIAAVFCLAGLAGAGLWAAGGLDRSAYDQLLEARTPLLTTVMKAVTQLGSPVGMIVLAALAALVLWRRFGEWLLAAVPAAAAAASTVTEVALKSIVGRQRPPTATMLVPESSAGFPSGHATVSAGLLVLLALLAPALVAERRVRSFQVGALLAVVVIGLSRLYLGVHWSTDVLAGWAIGAGIAAVFAVITLRIVRPVPTRRPDTAAAAVGR